ncbi:unnamed protein product [Chondrus crispus]|uniref:Bacterial bifunctional deaminase-reductase C-terminal domain-containing protein n=1 Tax=Chondrus crispus TaxID=2769 RepID=R7QJS9_CHOCR|nr:unnamed protein product [Chondrus crispus]CDF38782.1 unnamed protein product [Chondrus crispus]|eukprot:XP_005718687.1 unnamed protein product [Chondrus crispus]
MNDILDRLLSAHVKALASHPDRPFVCATWAQSANGMIAAAPGVRTLISGEESMQMTHMLRAAHDAILVGVGTALADDPRLSCRLKQCDIATVDEALVRHGIDAPRKTDRSPVPVILDPKLRTPAKSKFIEDVHRRNVACRPVVFFAERGVDQIDDTSQKALAELVQLESAPVEARKAEHAQHSSTLLSLPSVLQTLHKQHVSSVMVEGGAAVLSSFLKSGLCDLVVVTISPKLFGSGLTLADRSDYGSFPTMDLSDPKWILCGEDIVLVGAPQ